jgi:hypothetical protein
MNPATLRIIIAIVIIAHGIGHCLGVVPAFGVKLTPTHSAKSWLFTGIIGETGSRILIALIFSAAIVGFIGAGLGMFGWLVPGSMWMKLAAWSSILSIAGLVLFVNAFPTVFPNLVGAMAVNIAVLISLYWLHWPPDIVGNGL